MAELHLRGYICSNSDGIIALRDSKPNEEYSWRNYGESIIDSIERFADEHGLFGEHIKV